MDTNNDNLDDDIYKSCPNCGKLIKWEDRICPECNMPYPEIEYLELRGGMTHPVFAEDISKVREYKRPLSVTLIFLLGIAFVFALLAYTASKSPLTAIIIFFPIFILLALALVFINLRKNKKRMLGFLISALLMSIIFSVSFISFQTLEGIASSMRIPLKNINTAAGKIGITTTVPQTTLASAEADTETSTTSEATTTTVKNAYVFSVGDLIDFKGTIITAAEFERSAGNDTRKPKKGTEYIIVSVKIVNKTDNKIKCSPFDFKLQNNKGQTTGTIDDFGTLESCELETDGEIQGTIVFEGPKNDPELILFYHPSYFNEKDAVKISIR
ncbi:MAG: DUF4352 domain-containing protein [Candidatus Humimicrobiaceae bacterium]